KRLWIMDCPLSDRSMDTIGKWQSLERVEIYLSRDFKNSTAAMPTITDEGITRLAGLSHLHFLWLSNLSITHESTKIISKLPTLEAVGLQACTGMTDAALAPLINLPRLRELNVYGTNITDTGLETIALFKQIESLNVGQCPLITDEGLRCLFAMPKLKV